MYLDRSVAEWRDLRFGEILMAMQFSRRLGPSYKT
jgi:hypothetical protein